MLLITAATICQSAAQSPSSLNGGGGGGGGIGGGGGSGSNGASPLSAFLKSGGASYNQQLPQQQLFAMLTRNGVGSSGSGSLNHLGEPKRFRKEKIKNQDKKLWATTKSRVKKAIRNYQFKC